MQSMLAGDNYHVDWLANAHAVMLSYWDSTQDKTAIQQWLLTAPALERGVNHSPSTTAAITRGPICH